MILPKPQPFLFLRRAEQTHGRAGGRSFQQIGFALPVFPTDQVDRRVEYKPRLFIIAELFEF